MLPYQNRVTIQDIANMAGVSKTTVSRYLNGKFEYMSEETQRRIKEIIKKTEYTPSASAQSLKSNRSGLIGLLIADIGNPFSTALLTSITDALHHIGYNVLVANANNSSVLEAEYLDSFVSKGVDGMIINPVSWENHKVVSLTNRGLPIVLLDREVKDCDLDIVYLEHTLSIYYAVEHLKKAGYQDIWCFSWEHESVSTRYYRYMAFVNTMRAMGCSEPEKRVHIQPFGSGEGLPQVIERIVGERQGKNGVPAVITTNEILLIETVQAVKELGISMPQEMGLCGFDDWGWSDMIWPVIFSPTITTMDADIKRMGNIAASMIVNRIKQPFKEKKSVAIDVHLVERESTRLILSG